MTPVDFEPKSSWLRAPLNRSPNHKNCAKTLLKNASLFQNNNNYFTLTPGTYVYIFIEFLTRSVYTERRNINKQANIRRVVLVGILLY